MSPFCIRCKFVILMCIFFFWKNRGSVAWTRSSGNGTSVSFCLWVIFLYPLQICDADVYSSFACVSLFCVTVQCKFVISVYLFFFERTLSRSLEREVVVMIDVCVRVHVCVCMCVCVCVCVCRRLSFKHKRHVIWNLVDRVVCSTPVQSFPRQAMCVLAWQWQCQPADAREPRSGGASFLHHATHAACKMASSSHKSKVQQRAWRTTWGEVTQALPRPRPGGSAAKCMGDRPSATEHKSPPSCYIRGNRVRLCIQKWYIPRAWWGVAEQSVCRRCRICRRATCMLIDACTYTVT